MQASGETSLHAAHGWIFRPFFAVGADYYHAC
jgi:hypothetical protein